MASSTPNVPWYVHRWKCWSPGNGRVYDPCCGSGGMFVQSERFVTEHGGRIATSPSTAGEQLHHLAAGEDEPAVRGYRQSDIRWNNEGSFPQGRAARPRPTSSPPNPPFNISDYWGALARRRALASCCPSVGNANYAWLQHIFHHLARMALQAWCWAMARMSSAERAKARSEKPCWKLLVGQAWWTAWSPCLAQLFYSTQIPVCLWILAKSRSNGLRRSTKLR